MVGVGVGSQPASAGRKPDAPTVGTATAGNAEATVTFTAPSYTGKPNSSLTYTATSSPGSITGTNSVSPITVTGLSNGTAYTFTVKLNNTVMDSDSSAQSNSVTPVLPGPFFPPTFGPFFPPFFPPYFVPPYFVPPTFVPPYFVPPTFVQPPYFVPPYFTDTRL
jgi:hypothetical protein